MNNKKPSKKKVDKKPRSYRVVACIYSANNKQPDTVDITGKDRYFHHKKKTYLIHHDEVMVFRHSLPVPFMKSRHYIFYYEDNPYPLKIDGSLSATNTKQAPGVSVLPSHILNTILTSEAMRKVEKSGEMDLPGFLKDPKMIAIGLAVIGAVVYIAQGGSLT